MPKTVFTQEERDFVRDNASILTDKQGAIKLSETLGKAMSVNTYRSIRHELGIKKARGRGVCRIVTAEATPVVAATT
jgi:ribosomal protein S13